MNNTYINIILKRNKNCQMFVYIVCCVAYILKLTMINLKYTIDIYAHKSINICQHNTIYIYICMHTCMCIYTCYVYMLNIEICL